ncbi:MAG: type I 3-dehydroquinate dehydratase [Thermoproteota archaeon]
MRPRICVSIRASSLKKVSKGLITSRKLGASLAELRLDYLPEDQYAGLEEAVGDAEIGCIATIRPSWDGGAYSGDEMRRLSLFQKALEAPFSHVDVEYRSRILSEVCRLASRRGVGIIISYHDWRRTPGVEELKRMLVRMKGVDADAYKIVTTIRSTFDEAVLLHFLRSINESRLICFGMGGSGITRIISPLLGGFMVYASLDKPLAPGQLSIRKMVRIYRLMGVW